VAGLRSPSLADGLDVERGRGARVVVRDTLQLPTRPEVYVIGDMAYLERPDGSPYPMVAPVAIQQGELVAANIERRMAGQEPLPFVYRDRGMMVTIGRQAAVANVFGVPLSGFPAWIVWLTVHLIWLIGFRNRLLVLINWIWNYFTYERGSRLITDRRGKD
jgi:NADH dehydrogenase